MVIWWWFHQQTWGFHGIKWFMIAELTNYSNKSVNNGVFIWGQNTHGVIPQFDCTYPITVAAATRAPRHAHRPLREICNWVLPTMLKADLRSMACVKGIQRSRLLGTSSTANLNWVTIDMTPRIRGAVVNSTWSSPKRCTSQLIYIYIYIIYIYIYIICIYMYIYIICIYIYMVGGIPTPLKNMSSSMGRIIPYIMEKNIFETTNHIYI